MPLPTRTPVAALLSALSTSQVGIAGRPLSLRCRLFNVGVVSAGAVRFDDFSEFELELEPTASYQRLLHSIADRCHWKRCWA